jgi:dTDP-4-dehydrorhamnose reductase
VTLLVFGAAGQLGRALFTLAPAEGIDTVGLDRRDVDVTDIAAVRRAVEGHRPDAVINAAAYTAVDRAEQEPDLAHAVNHDGARHLAEACAAAGVPLVHVSTDYVFDGLGEGPYAEDAPTGPTGVYGRSKLAGELAVRRALPGAHLIVRTAWVFSATGHNFVRTMLRLARERETLRVVADQYGSPTAADDLAAALLAMARRLLADPSVAGTYHWAGTPPTTWHGLAEAVVEEARRHGPVAAHTVEPIPTSAYPTPAARPANSVLDTTKAERVFGIAPPDWRAAVARVVERLWKEG